MGRVQTHNVLIQKKKIENVLYLNLYQTISLKSDPFYPSLPYGIAITNFMSLLEAKQNVVLAGRHGLSHGEL